jgi:hypothetical protein
MFVILTHKNISYKICSCVNNLPLQWWQTQIDKELHPNGRRNQGRPLKRLLDAWDRNDQQVAQLLDSYMMTHRPDDGGSTYLWNVGRHSVKNTAVHTRRFWASWWWLMTICSLQSHIISGLPSSVNQDWFIRVGLPYIRRTHSRHVGINDRGELMYGSEKPSTRSLVLWK